MAQELFCSSEPSHDEKRISGFTSSSIFKGNESICSKDSIFLDIKWRKHDQGCRNNLCVRDHTRSLLHDLAEHESSDFLSNFSVSVTPSMEVLFESLGQSRRSRSMNNLAKLIEDYYSLMCSSPMRLSFDSISGVLPARTLVLAPLYMLAVHWPSERTLMEGRLHFQLSIIDDAKYQVTAISSGGRHNDPSGVITSPASICKAPLTQFCSKAVLACNRVSDVKNCDEIPHSAADNNPKNFSGLTLNANCSMIKGQIKCQWKSGTPYFVFAVGDDCTEVYLSRPWKIKSSGSEGFDYMYLFHSRSVNQLDSDNYASDESDIHGKMKVSNRLMLNSDGSRTRETEFVLYSTIVKSSVKMQSSYSVIKKSKRLRKKVVGMFRPNHASKHKSTLKLHESGARFDALSTKCLSMFRNYNERDLINQFQNDCTPDLELAAVVLKNNREDTKRDAEIGGWGLRFLGRSPVNDDLDTSVPFVNCIDNQGIDREKSSENLAVLVPAGLHGGPSTDGGGPSSIIGRWRSRGHCDCGGWDVGCPLQVLTCSSSISIKKTKALFKEELQDDSKTIDLFIEGTKKTESMIQMVDMNDDLYIIYFHPSLSALQTFSIGVAIIHAQSPCHAPYL